MLLAIRIVRGFALGALTVLGMLGLALLVQDVRTAVGSVAVGAAGGVVAGVVVRWSQERTVRMLEALGFVAAGAAAFGVLHATSVIGGWSTLLALVLAAAWWGLSSAERSLEGSSGAGLPGRADSVVRRLPEMDLAELCRLWESLQSDPVPTRPGARPDRRLVWLRERLLDELERRDPQGFARWLSDGATHSPGRYVS